MAVHFFLDVFHDGFLLVAAGHNRILGGYGGGVPPLPIPNREVKPACADGTAMQCGRVGGRPLSILSVSRREHTTLAAGFFCARDVQPPRLWYGFPCAVLVALLFPFLSSPCGRLPADCLSLAFSQPVAPFPFLVLSKKSV